MLERFLIQDFCSYWEVPAQGWVSCKELDRGLVFPDFCGYWEILAQVMAYIDEGTKWIIFQAFCGHLRFKRWS